MAAAEQIDNELLIHLVQERPVLWDKSLGIFKDRNETKNAWLDVCRNLMAGFDLLEDGRKNSFVFARFNETMKVLVEEANDDMSPYMVNEEMMSAATRGDDLDVMETVDARARHWCDLSGVWISDDGTVLLTLGFPSTDNSQLTGFLTQVSVDMTPGGDHSKNWRRRRNAKRQRRHGSRSQRQIRARLMERERQRHADRQSMLRMSPTVQQDLPEIELTHPPHAAPHFPPPGAGASGIPAALTNRTIVQGSAVSRSGPFAVVTRHSWGAVGTMIGQCQMCAGLDTIVARFYSEVEVFDCHASLWSEKSVRLLFRKWADRMAQKDAIDDELETKVVIKQRQLENRIPRV